MNPSFWRKWASGGLTEKTDDELMEMIRDGNHQAFEALFDRHSGKLLGYTQRLLGNRDRAEDVSQEVWMKVARSAESYQRQGHFIAWLFTIARNTSFNSLRKDKAWEELDESTSELEDPSQNLEETLEKYENLEELKKQIDLLPAQQRAVLVMSLNDELSYEEMATELQMTVSAVKSLLFRARKRLQENWGPK